MSAPARAAAGAAESPLSRRQADALMAEVVDGALDDAQVAELLRVLRARGETAEEILGFADCLRRRAVAVRPGIAEVMDVCGTGGDGLGTFNVSTTVAFVLAAAGVTVAKHGNRSVSSRSGSFDVLDALRIRHHADPAAAARGLRRDGLGFLFAPAFHPALKRLAPVRRQVGVSVFNALGPLLNPVALTRQLIGVFRPELTGVLAEALRAQGVREAMVVRGEDGLDEITLSGPTRVAHLRNGRVREYRLRPSDFGLKEAPLEALRGGLPAENARTLIDLLSGCTGPRRDLVLINAAAALVVAGRAAGFREGVWIAAEAIDSGAARERLHALQGPEAGE